MFIYGGTLHGENQNFLYSISLKTFVWQKVDYAPFAFDAKNLPPACDEHSAVVYEKEMYIFGGFVDCIPTNFLFKYDFNFKMWQKVVSIKYLLYEVPCARTGHSAVTV